jgi:Transposase
MNAWVSENYFCVAQQRIEDKTNEITAIPRILDSLDVSDTVVSIDAIGTQTKIASQIREQKVTTFFRSKEIKTTYWKI